MGVQGIEQKLPQSEGEVAGDQTGKGGTWVEPRKR